MSPVVPALPRSPVLGRDAFAGPTAASMASVLACPERVYTTSGQAAIALALRLLNLARGERVLVPTYHCPTMIAPVVAAGGEPVFYPLDASGVPQLAAISALLTQQPARAMLVPHYFGIPTPMASIRAFCDTHGLVLIEDCAHCFFGESDGQPVGSWGDYAIASLTKFFPVVEGGLLVSNRQPLQQAGLHAASLKDELRVVFNTLERSATHGRLGSLALVFRAIARLRRRPPPAAGHTQAGQTEHGSGNHQRYGLQATRVTRWLCTHVALDRILRLRRRNAGLLLAQLQGLPQLRPLAHLVQGNHVPYVVPLWLDEPEAAYQALRGAGVPVFRWDYAWPGTPELAGDTGHRWSHHVLQIACHQDLSIQQMADIAQQLQFAAKGAAGTLPQVSCP